MSAAARVGGIHQYDPYPADFIRENLEIQTRVVDAAYRNGVTRLAFPGLTLSVGDRGLGLRDGVTSTYA